MATQALVDATMWTDSFDWTTQSNAVNLADSVEVLDSTTFGGGGYRARTAGLKSTALQMRGFADMSTTDVQGSPQLGTQRVFTVAHDDAETSVAYFFRARKFSVETAAAIGQLVGFTVDAQGSDGVGRVRGQVAKAKADVSATGATGSGLNLGAVGSTQSLYASFHVFVAGTTITVLVESDDNSGFTTPTTRATIGPLTTTGGTWLTPVAGPITDTWWRFNVSAITGTFRIAGAIGIR